MFAGGLILCLACPGCRSAARTAQKASRLEALDNLRSLPYGAFAAAGPVGQAPLEGVTLWNPEQAYPGLNLFVPRPLSVAVLMNMGGRILHTWSMPDREWHHVELSRNGALLVITRDRYMARLARDSTVLWLREDRFHHDLLETEEGNLWVLNSEDRILVSNGQEIPFITDLPELLNRDGERIRRMDLYAVLKDFVPEPDLQSARRWGILNQATPRIKSRSGVMEKVIEGNDHPGDLLYSNSIAILPRDIQGLGKKGDILICARNLNLVAVLDARREEVLWHWGPGELERPHHLTILPNGHLLVFDNGTQRKFSRILELDPVTRSIQWVYQEPLPARFYTEWGGASQRLPNGNTLITDSASGRVFEVTRAGEKVWEYYSELVEGKPAKGRSPQVNRSIYRLERIISPGLLKTIHSSVIEGR